MWASILKESHKPEQNAITLSSCPPQLGDGTQAKNNAQLLKR